MRDHIRREAAQYSEAAWWLVPITFAFAALAAVAFTDYRPAEEETQVALHAQAAPAAAAMPVAATPAQVPALPQPADTSEISEPIQAF